MFGTQPLLQFFDTHRRLLFDKQVLRHSALIPEKSMRHIAVVVHIKAAPRRKAARFFFVIKFQYNVAAKRLVAQVGKAAGFVITQFAAQVSQKRAAGFSVGGFVEVIAAGVSQQNKLQCINDRGFTGACLTG